MHDIVNAAEIDVEKKAELLKNHLDILVAQALYTRSMSSHEVVGEIFRRHGVVVNPLRCEETLSSLERRGLVQREKSGLVTFYTLTEKGKHAEFRTSSQGM